METEIYWRHEKGGVYRIVDFVTDEATCRPMVLYQEVDKVTFEDVLGHRWVRLASVFFSGKFTQFQPETNFRPVGEIAMAGVVSPVLAARLARQRNDLAPDTLEYPDSVDGPIA